jgi:hypothetical protein
MKEDSNLRSSSPNKNKKLDKRAFKVSNGRLENLNIIQKEAG